PLLGTAKNRLIDARMEVRHFSLTLLELLIRQSRLQEMIDQALARPGVVGEPLVEIGMLEDDVLGNRGDRRTALAEIVPRGPANLVVIGFLASIQRGQKVVANRADVQLVQMSAA